MSWSSVDGGTVLVILLMTGVTVLTRAPRPSARRSAVRDALAGVPALAGVSEIEVPVDRRVEDAIWAADLPGRGAFTQAMDRLWRVLAVPFGGARVAR